jgi:hypothetical protein
VWEGVRRFPLTIQVIVVSAWLFATGAFAPKAPPAPAGWHTTQYSDWSAFGSLIPEDRTRPYCVPLNPYPRMFGVGCEQHLAPNPRAVLATRPADEVVETVFPAPESVRDHRLVAVGIAVRSTVDGETPSLRAYDVENRLIATGEWVSGQRGFAFSFFTFPDSPWRVAKIELKGVRSMVYWPAAPGQPATPLWVWLGGSEERSAATAVR